MSREEILKGCNRIVQGTSPQEWCGITKMCSRCKAKLEGYDQALQDVLEIVDKWYKDWKKDKTQEFWKDDLQLIKDKIKELKGETK